MARCILLAVLAAACSSPAIPCVAPEDAPRPNVTKAPPVSAENAREGGDGWQIDRLAEDGQIEGYASAPSITAGESLRVFVRTASAPEFTVEAWRIGWYGGRGGRSLLAATTYPRRAQPDPITDDLTGLITCPWTASATITTDASWPPGIYMVKLTALPSGHQRYVPFVIRDDAARGTIVFQTAFSTALAYNEWGGRSTYKPNPAIRVSLDRPFQRGQGAGDFFLTEVALLRFLEREGVPLSYVTSLDVHRHGEFLLDQRAFFSAGHDEYWSLEMRDAVEAARDAGVSVTFFAGNAAYWAVRFEPNARGEPDREMVAYKERLSADPHKDDARASGRWRDKPIERPENHLSGVRYEYGFWGFETDWTARAGGHWLLEGTGLDSGSVLTGLAGGEADHREDGTPSCVTLIGDAEFSARDEKPGKSETTLYFADSGALVFAWGSHNLAFGLEPRTVPPREPSLVQDGAQTIVKNLVRRIMAE